MGGGKLFLFVRREGIYVRKYTYTGESAVRSLVADRPVCGELGNGVWAWPVRLLLGPPYPIQEPNQTLATLTMH